MSQLLKLVHCHAVCRQHIGVSVWGVTGTQGEDGGGLIGVKTSLL